MCGRMGCKHRHGRPSPMSSSTPSLETGGGGSVGVASVWTLPGVLRWLREDSPIPLESGVVADRGVMGCSAGVSANSRGANSPSRCPCPIVGCGLHIFQNKINRLSDRSLSKVPDTTVMWCVCCGLHGNGLNCGQKGHTRSLLFIPFSPLPVPSPAPVQCSLCPIECITNTVIDLGELFFNL